MFQGHTGIVCCVGSSWHSRKQLFAVSLILLFIVRESKSCAPEQGYISGLRPVLDSFNRNRWSGFLRVWPIIPDSAKLDTTELHCSVAQDVCVMVTMIVLPGTALRQSLLQSREQLAPIGGWLFKIISVSSRPLMAVAYHIRVVKALDGCFVSYACPQGPLWLFYIISVSYSQVGG